jgi:hypothetical protein
MEGAFGLGVTVDYSTLSGLGGTAILSVSLGRDGRDGSWYPQARPLAGSGAISARAFLDTNGNGLMDAAEQPIAGAGYLLNGASGPARTNDAGEAFMANLPPYQELEVGLASSTFEDPYWREGRDAVKILPRPGKVAVIDFPVLVSGEVSGTIDLQRDGRRIAATGVELELVDRHGVVVKRTKSAYDGFYDVTDVLPGSYTLSVTAEHITRLGMAAPSRDIEIGPEGTVLDGVDLHLRNPQSAMILLPTASEPIAHGGVGRR